MYSTEKPKSSPAFGQQVPVTGVPVSRQAPAPLHVHHPGAGGSARWSTGLCDCFSDVPNCCITFWCPCITFGQIAEIVDEGSTSCGVSGALYGLLAMVTGCACCYSCFYRSRLRNQYSLGEHPCNDCCVHFWCETCALCQEYRELKNRGFDMSIGWNANMQRMQNGGGRLPTAPVVETQMQR